jgi:phosphoglycerol transferase
MGIVGDLGFIFLVGWLLCSPHVQTHRELLNALAVVTFSALLLGTMGGLGAIFNYLISPQFRAYNRISIYIAFCSLFAAAVLLDGLGRWIGDRNRTSYVWYGALVGILCLGILDQTSPSFAPDYAGLKNRYQKEQELITQLELSVPRGAMIFQLPNEGFPEADPIAAMGPYDELKGYLHSESLRWSSGAMRGRPEARWPERNGLDLGAETIAAGTGGKRRAVLQLPPQALDALVFAGFSGIYLDRHGFWDLGLSLVSQLQTLLGEAPIESRDRRFVFFNLSAFAQALRAKYTPEQWEAEHRRVLGLEASNS